ncbi:nucleotide exchange factor GrpE [Tuberibacillus sp. Marseille-P3662]|uniref:nucleotide exchange factor GrpE n=1 Tax=Tuberibacillus sp. Marseille-P3662 TaxID=1965358 RepID=UPI0026E443B5|nr:nucleotide exchange factor GrpE [Tuberibacillus sp. Marseille-P3662]
MANQDANQDTVNNPENIEENHDHDEIAEPVEAELVEEDEPVSEQADHQALIEEKNAALKEQQQENESLKNRLLRVQADYDNFKRRTKDEKEQERKYRSQKLVEDLLPVMDNFERALETEEINDSEQSLKQGMDMVYKQLKEALEKEGVEVIEALNQPFDPNVHQAVMQVDSDELESNTVAEVLQKGYTLNGRVVRPAMVKVSS